jgi:hypothetical protein
MSQPHGHGPDYYREHAAVYGEKAAAALDSAVLRESYLALAVCYERLADVLEEKGLLPRSGKLT